MRRLAIVPALLALAGPAGAQSFDDVTIRSERVAEGLHVLYGRGGNIGVVSGPDGVFLVDDQFAPLHEKIVAAVRAIAPEGELRFVVNTHWHGDHVGGNEAMGRQGALLVAHENVRRRMSVAQVMKLRPMEIPAAAPGALPVVTFTESLRFHLNGITISVEHPASAHTDGDALVWLEERDAVHMGDVYFNGIYPFVDVDSGGSIDGTIAAVEAALERIGPATRVIPGHGPVSGRAELEAYLEMLRDVRSRVATLIAEGKSAEQVLAAKPSAAWDAEWGDGFLDPDTFVRLIHASLSR